jgi:hypothetical protein
MFLAKTPTNINRFWQNTEKNCMLSAVCSVFREETEKSVFGKYAL